MKVAVSIPDSVFAEAETLVKRFRTSRSELYSRALHAFIGQHAPDRVTQEMNTVVDSIGQAPDAFVAEASRRTLASTEW